MRMLLAILSSLGAAGAMAAETLVVPADVHELIQARGCSQVSDFYTRPAIERPPYALTSLDHGRVLVAVWCIRPSAVRGSQQTYTLLTQIDQPAHPLAVCPKQIDGIQWIGGLAFVDVNGDTAGYYFVDTQKPVGTRSLRTKGIESSYDGLTTFYICVDGRWAAKSLD